MKEDTLLSARPSEVTASFREIIDAMPAAVILCEEGAIVFANLAARKLLGAQSSHEIAGRKLLCFLQPHEYDQIHNLIDVQPVASTDAAWIIVRFIRLDGTELVAEVTASRVKDSNTVQIIARRKEKSIPTFEPIPPSKNNVVVEESLDAVLTTNPEGIILNLNKSCAELLGLESAKNASGMNFTLDMCVVPKQREMLMLALKRQGFIKNFEYEIKRSDGSKRLVLENAIASCDNSGKLINVRSRLLDITDWKELEQQLFQAKKMESIGTLVASIAHDFVNVLNNLSGFSSQLRKHPEDTTKVVRYAEAIERSTEHGLVLAKQLMSFVKKKKSFSSTARVQDVIAEIEVLAETFPKNIVIKAAVDSNLPSVAADAGELYQALMNICLNARDAMPLGGTLRVEAQPYSPKEGEALFVGLEVHLRQFVRIVIEDSGQGIPPHNKDKIFDPFFTTKERSRGTGLGLSIVYNIVKNFKGVISVDSESNRGSTFSMYIPVADVYESKTVTQEQSEIKQPNNELILLVDDEPMMQELGSEILLEQGYRVIVARDGVEAVELYRRNVDDIALVILDLLMPRLDGGQTYLQLKKINKNVKAFFCTGYSPDEVIGPLLAKESLTALQKPFRPEEFILTVRETLSST